MECPLVEAASGPQNPGSLFRRVFPHPGLLQEAQGRQIADWGILEKGPPPREVVPLEARRANAVSPRSPGQTLLKRRCPHAPPTPTLKFPRMFKNRIRAIGYGLIAAYLSHSLNIYFYILHLQLRYVTMVSAFAPFGPSASTFKIE